MYFFEGDLQHPHSILMLFMREYADQTAIAHSSRERITEIEKAVAGRGVGTPQSQIVRARENDRGERVNLFEEWLREIVT